MIEKHVLITNLRDVVLNDVHMSVSAIVISRSLHGHDGKDVQLMLRGFGPDAGWVVFDQRPKSVEYELEDATPEMPREDERFFINGHRQYTATKLVVDGMELTLYHEEPEFELDVKVFEEHRDGRPILKVWDELLAKVAKYWTAPGVPVVIPLPVEVVREAAQRGSDTLRNLLRSRLM